MKFIRKRTGPRIAVIILKKNKGGGTNHSCNVKNLLNSYISQARAVLVEGQTHRSTEQRTRNKPTQIPSPDVL